MVELIEVALDGVKHRLQLRRREYSPRAKKTITWASLVLDTGEIIPLGDPHQRITPDPVQLEADIRQALLFRAARGGLAPLHPATLANVVALARVEDASDGHIGARLAQYVLHQVADRIDGEAGFFAASAQALRVVQEELAAMARQTTPQEVPDAE